MGLNYSLTNSIPSEKIIRDVSEMISKFIHNGGDTKNSILNIQILTIQDYGGDSLLPKLTYQGDVSPNIS